MDRCPECGERRFQLWDKVHISWGMTWSAVDGKLVPEGPVEPHFPEDYGGAMIECPECGWFECAEGLFESDNIEEIFNGAFDRFKSQINPSTT